MQSIEETLPDVVANLKARHPEMVEGLDDDEIGSRFLDFHGTHDMTRAALAACMCGQSRTVCRSGM